MGGRLARKEDQGVARGWFPSMEDTGDAGSEGGASAFSLSVETPAQQTRTQHESGTEQQSSVSRQPQHGRHVSWSGPQLGERGSGGSMAVSDEDAAVGGQVGTPQMRLMGTRPAPSAGRRGVRSEGIAAPEEDGVSRMTPLPMKGVGEAQPETASKAGPKADQPKDKPPPPKGKEKRQRVDLQLHPELCLSAEEQIDKVRTDSVTRLIDAIPWEKTALGKPDGDGPGSYGRTEGERYEALVRALYAKGPSRNKSTATILYKMAAILSEKKGSVVAPTEIFPIEVGFMEIAKQILENTQGGKTAAKGMHEDIAWLRQLGLPVPSEEEVDTSLARRSLRRPAALGTGRLAAPNSRQPLSPKMVLEIEWFSIYGRHRDDPEAMKHFAETGEHMPPPLTEFGDIMPAQVYALAEWAQIAGCDRGVGIWSGTWDEPVDPNTAKYTVCIDKGSRLFVPRVVPDGAFEHETHPLIVAYSRKMVGRPLTPFFRYEKGESRHPFKSGRWCGPGDLVNAPVVGRPTAMGALVSTRSHVTKVPESTLVALQMSGNHTDRHVAPEISANLSWPEAEIGALGDWSEPSDEPKTSGSGRKKKKPNMALACNSTAYHPNATEEHTMESRKRLTDAARAFIVRAGGYEKLSSDTLWSDIIPRKCPGPEFEQFYGASWSLTGADAIGEAAMTLTVAIERGRRSSRDRYSPASKEAGQ